jgi:DNA-binding NarL/FixJ family response regulator
VEALRLVLAGNCSRLRHLMTGVARARPDLEIVAELDDAFTATQLEEALTALHADVAVLDTGEHAVSQPAPTLHARPGGAALALMIVERLPQVVAVVLCASGRRAIVHSAVFMDDVGLNALIETMRSAHRGSAALIARRCDSDPRQGA